MKIWSKRLKYVLLLSVISIGVELDEIAVDLNGNSTLNTANNVAHYIMADYSYEFNYYPKKIVDTFLDRSGDCTDFSNLAVYLLKKNSIESKTVHGYAVCNEKRVKHDWIEVWNGRYFLTGDFFPNCKKHKKIGNGVW